MLNISQPGQKFKLTPTQVFLIFLSIYSLIALISNFSLNLLAMLAGEIAFSLLLNFLLNIATARTKSIENTLISTLIFLLVLHYIPTAFGIFATIIGIIFLQLYKRFFYYRGNSIFNPVLIGVFFSMVTSFILQNLFHVNELDLPFVSWWGAYFSGYLSLILLVIWLLVEIRQWHKNFILIAFLAVYLIGTLIVGGTEFAVNSMSTSTIYFFAFIMLVEPRTSPAVRNQQIIYGTIAAVSFIILRYLNLNNFELFSLAIANLYNFFLR